MLEQIQQYLPQITIFTVLSILIYFAHKSTASTFNVFDYFLDPVTRRASITRTGQTIAILTATWIVAKQAALSTLTVEMFAVYLAALGVSEAWSKLIGAKYGVSPQETKEQDSKPQDTQN